MKLKILLFTVIFAFISENALAGEVEYGISGTAQALYGYSDVAENYNSAHSEHNFSEDATINAYAKYIFDNELEAGLYVDLMISSEQELEDYNQGLWGEEVYGIIDSSYGRLMIGQTYNIARQFHVGAPNSGLLGTNNIDIVNFIINPNWQRDNHATKFATLNSSAINTDGVAGKISYISPEIYNTTLGFSYVPDSYNRRGLINKQASYRNTEAYVFSAYNYFDVDSLEVETSVSYADYTDIDKEFSAGMRLSYGNWSLGGSWRKTYTEDNDVALNQVIDNSTPQFFDEFRSGYAWDLGLGYNFGPIDTSLSYFKSASIHTSNQDEIIAFSNHYQYNKNLDMYLTVAHVDFEGDNLHFPDSNRGYAVISGLSLSF